MSQNSFARKLLSLLNKHHSGMTRPEIWKIVNGNYENDEKAIAVYLSTLVDKGRIRVDGKRECCECGKSYTVYRISDKGRIWLNE